MKSINAATLALATVLALVSPAASVRHAEAQSSGYLDNVLSRFTLVTASGGGVLFFSPEEEEVPPTKGLYGPPGRFVGSGQNTNVSLSADGLRVARVVSNDGRYLRVQGTSYYVDSTTYHSIGSTDFNGPGFKPYVAFSGRDSRLAVFTNGIYETHLMVLPETMVNGAGGGTEFEAASFYGTPVGPPVWNFPADRIAYTDPNDGQIVTVSVNTQSAPVGTGLFGRVFGWDVTGLWYLNTANNRIQKSQLDGAFLPTGAVTDVVDVTQLTGSIDGTDDTSFAFADASAVDEIHVLNDLRTLSIVGTVTDGTSNEPEYRAFYDVQTGDRRAFKGNIQSESFGLVNTHRLIDFDGNQFGGGGMVLSEPDPHDGRFGRLPASPHTLFGLPSTTVRNAYYGAVRFTARHDSPVDTNLRLTLFDNQGSIFTSLPVTPQQGWRPYEFSLANRFAFTDSITGTYPNSSRFRGVIQRATAATIEIENYEATLDLDDIFVGQEWADSWVNFEGTPQLLSHIPLSDIPTGQPNSPAVDLAPLRMNLTDLAPLRLNLVDLSPLRLNLTDLAPLRLNIVDLAPLRLNLTDLAPLVKKGLSKIGLGTFPHAGGCWSEIADASHKPVQAMTLLDVLQLEPRPDCLDDTTLGDLDFSGSIAGSLTVDAILLGGVPMGDLNLPSLCPSFEAAGYGNCGAEFGGADATMVEAQIAGVPHDLNGSGKGIPPVSQLLMGPLMGTDAALFAIPVPTDNLYTSSLGSIRVEQIDDPDAVFAQCPCEPEATLYELRNQIRSAATVRDLAGPGLSALTLSEIGASVIPAEQRPVEENKFSELGVKSYGNTESVAFEFTAGQRMTNPKFVLPISKGVQIEGVDAYLYGGEYESAPFALKEAGAPDGGPDDAPYTVSDGVLEVDLAGLFANGVAFRSTQIGIDLSFVPGVEGAGAPFGEGRITSAERTGWLPAVDVEIRDGLEPNDTPEDAFNCEPGFVWIGFANGDDADYCYVEVEDNQELLLGLQPGDTDLDMVVYHGEGQGPAELLRTLRRPDPRILPVTDNSAKFASAGGLPTEPRDDVTIVDNHVVAALAAHNGTETERARITGPGEFLIQITKAATAVDSAEPYMLKVAARAAVTDTATAPPAAEIPTLGGSLPNQAAPDTKTLFLAASGRMAQLYGAPETNQMLTSLATVAARDEVAGEIWHVDADPAVRAAFAEFDANLSNPLSANRVVRAINDAVSARLPDGGPGSVKNIVLVGGDRILPHARLIDGAVQGAESGFASSVAADEALFGALSRSRFLSDDPYASFDPLPWLDRFLYPVDVALGRVLESPAEIVAQVDEYLQYNGRLDPQSVASVGSDFMKDVAAAQNKSAELRTGETQTLLANDDFGRAELLSAAGNGVDLLNLNVHMSPTAAQASNGDIVGADDMLLGFDDVWFGLSMGCHSGVNRLDAISVGPVKDWSQMAGVNHAAGWVGQSGYGFGSKAGITLSEWVVRRTNEYLNGSVTTGEALRLAKMDYLSSQGIYDVYDERVSQQSLLAGFPFWTVGDGNAELPAAPALPEILRGVDPRTDLAVSSFTASPAAERVDTPDGSYFADPDFGTSETIDRPIEPLFGPVDVTSSEGRAHGALITRLVTTELPNFRPALLDVELSGGVNVTGAAAAGIFPEAPQNVIRTTGPNGPKDSVSVITGQFIPTGDGVGIQSLISDVDVTVFHSTSDDFKNPTFGSVDLKLNPDLGFLTLAVKATDASGVNRVVACVQDGTGTWACPDLDNDNGTFKTTLGVAGRNFRVCFQAVDGAGNVGINCLKAGGVTPKITDEVPTGGVVSAVPVTGATSNGFTKDNTVSFQRSNPAIVVSYRIDHGQNQTWDGNPIAIPNTHGAHTLIWTSSSGQGGTLNFLVDGTGPEITVHGVTDGAQFPRLTDVDVSIDCVDPASGLDRCEIVSSVDTSTHGAKTFIAEATDLLGNLSRVEVPYEVVYNPAVDSEPAEASVSGYRLANDWWGHALVKISGDPAIQIRYSVDGGTPTMYSSAIYIPPTDGPHEVSWDELYNGQVIRSGSIEVKIDTGAPVIRVAYPRDGEVITLGSQRPAEFECNDRPGGSGVATCYGADFDASTVGTRTMTVTTMDNAGRTERVTRQYKVVYGPLDLGPDLTQGGYFNLNAGSNKPILMKVNGPDGKNITTSSTVAGVSRAIVPCPANTPSASTSSLPVPVGISVGLWSPLEGGYRYNLYTPLTDAGKCSSLRIALNDGTTRTVTFKH